MDVDHKACPWQWTPKKRSRDAMDVFFEEGDRYCWFSTQQICVELDEAEAKADISRQPEFLCGISGCGEQFNSIIGYESHYNSVHRYMCSGCRRTLPSNHLLEIHLRESHDPLFHLQTGDKYTCLVQGCQCQFVTAKSRRDHLIERHKYPANFRFDRAKRNKDPASRTTVSKDMSASPSRMEVSEKETVAKDRGGRRVYSYKVPQSICFGQGSSRGFQRQVNRRKGKKHWHQSETDMDTTVHIENVNMTDLHNALTDQ